MAKGEVYKKGNCVSVLATSDDKGTPSSSIERDGDGVQWHVQDGKSPVVVSDEEAQKLIAAAWS